MIMPTGCSIWLIPTGRTFNDLSRIISLLSNEYATPRFPPHVTLVEALAGDEKDLSSKTDQLASRIRPFEITLTAVGYLDEYFRCLFFQVEESPALLEAAQTARGLFHQELNTRFMPHLSLLYGNLDPATKKQIIKSIDPDFNRTFLIERLHLYSTNGEPSLWRLVQESAMRGHPLRNE